MADERILKIALIGCGGMAVSYRHRYTEIKGARLALVVDADGRVARDAAQQLDVEQWSTDFKDCLIQDIDVVDISTPNYLHAEQAIAALNAGKHVLLQKPLATTVKEAEDIVKAANRNKLQAGMYMSKFDNPLYYDVKKLVTTGKLGRISGVHCRGAHNGGLSASATGWRSSLEKTGGGSFIQLAVHEINMLQWLLDDRIARVTAFCKNMMCPNIGGDDVTAAACEFSDGVLGALESSYCAAPYMLSIYGTKGFIIIINDMIINMQLEETYEGDVIRYISPGTVSNMNCGYESFSLFKESNPCDQHIAFIKALQQGKPAPVAAEVGLYDLKIVSAIYRSAVEKHTIEVN